MLLLEVTVTLEIEFCMEKLLEEQFFGILLILLFIY